MTKEECVKLKNSFKLVSHNGFKAYLIHLERFMFGMEKNMLNVNGE